MNEQRYSLLGNTLNAILQDLASKPYNEAALCTRHLIVDKDKNLCYNNNIGFERRIFNGIIKH